jgi:hypothetical protein
MAVSSNNSDMAQMAVRTVRGLQMAAGAVSHIGLYSVHVLRL